MRFLLCLWYSKVPPNGMSQWHKFNTAASSKILSSPLTFSSHYINREEITDEVDKESRNTLRFVHNRLNIWIMSFQWTKQYLALFFGKLITRHTHTHTHTRTHISDFHLICGNPLTCKCHVLGSLLWHPSHIYSWRKYNGNFFLRVCTVYQWQLKQFIVQQMHKYIILRYNYNYYKKTFKKYLKLLQHVSDHKGPIRELYTVLG